MTGSLRTCTEFPFHPCGHSHRVDIQLKTLYCNPPPPSMCQGYFVHFVEARALPSFSRRGRCPHRPAGLDCESASAEHTCPSLPLRRGGAKRRRGWGCDGVTGLSQAPHPPREAADAARADEGIGPYGKIVPWYVRRRHSDVAAKRTRDARPYGGNGKFMGKNCRV